MDLLYSGVVITRVDSSMELSMREGDTIIISIIIEDPLPPDGIGNRLLENSTIETMLYIVYSNIIIYRI